MNLSHAKKIARKVYQDKRYDSRKARRQLNRYTNDLDKVLNNACPSKYPHRAYYSWSNFNDMTRQNSSRNADKNRRYDRDAKTMLISITSMQ
jgi:hypothetical protein